MTLEEIFGGAVTPSRWFGLGQYLRRHQITGGVGVRVRRDNVLGTLISAGRQYPSGGRGVSEYTPWAPTFTTTGTAPSLSYFCRFNLGTLNNVAASNWDTVHTLPTDTSVRFVFLEVTTSDGKVTGLEIQLSTTAPIEDAVLIDTPPPVHKILLGVVDRSTGSMIETTNLSAAAVEVYRASKTVVTPGSEPFSRYWRWDHSSAS